MLLGMNPGPWGMAQTGVPFGEIEAVRDWLKISAPVEQPENMHPKRPIEGFDCSRSEVSGRRLWGYFAELFKSAEEFRNQFVIFNYCPLIFLEESGRNRTPDKLSKKEREALNQAFMDLRYTTCEATPTRREVAFFIRTIDIRLRVQTYEKGYSLTND